jgi:hypothetical protein
MITICPAENSSAGFFLYVKMKSESGPIRVYDEPARYRLHIDLTGTSVDPGKQGWNRLLKRTEGLR